MTPNMKPSRKVIPKKRGRPATGKDPARAFRLSDAFMAGVDAWSCRTGRPAKPSA
jgi:hypothetical protein